MTSSDGRWARGFLSRLIALDTDSERKTNYSECAGLVRDAARGLGLSAAILADPKASPARPNAVAEYDCGAPTTIVIATHFDVVPPGEGWTKNPFKMEVKGGKAFGRGASDDKGAIVASLLALKKAVEKKSAKNNVIFVCACDEEVGGSDAYGLGYVARRLGKKLSKSAGAFVPDAGMDSVSFGSCGLVFGKMTVKGKPGHASVPFENKNPVDGLASLLVELRRFRAIREKTLSKFNSRLGKPMFGRFTVTMLSAGVKENVIPATATAKFDLRLNPEEKAAPAISSLEKFFQDACGRLGIDAELEITSANEGCFSDPDSPMVLATKRAAQKAFKKKFGLCVGFGGTDAPALVSLGVPTALFGPIANDCGYHGPDEFIRISDLEKMADLIYELICTPIICSPTATQAD